MGIGDPRGDKGKMIAYRVPPHGVAAHSAPPIRCPPATRPAVRPVVARHPRRLRLPRSDAGQRDRARARCRTGTALLATCPHTAIDASELAVGLPRGTDGQLRGRPPQHRRRPRRLPGLTRASTTRSRPASSRAIPALTGAVAAAARRRRDAARARPRSRPAACTATSGRSPRWSSWRRRAARRASCVHAFLDGRDTPPQSAGRVARRSWQDVCARHPGARIASIVGRYYAMDRDQRWERVAEAYDLLVDGRAPYTARIARRRALAAAYARGETDEFVHADGDRRARRRAPTTIADGDVVVFMNFRADRARQITRALTDPAFDGFPRAPRAEARARSSASRATATSSRDLPVAFRAAVGRATASASTSRRSGSTQLRIAETEKYAHVTYFFNGGVEAPYPGEDRILVPSPKVATYDLKPEMSAFEVTDKLVAAIGIRQVRRDRLQLRQRRHGRPHRQPRRGDQGGRDARRVHRPRRRRRRAPPAARC